MTLAFINREINQFITLYLAEGGNPEELIRLLAAITTDLRMETNNA